MYSGNGRSYTWDAANRPTAITANGVTETYRYDGDGNRATRTRNGQTTVYFQGLWEDTLGVNGRKLYSFGGQVVAIRDGAGAVTYPHGDHLGSVSVVTDAGGNLPPGGKQEFDPWGSTTPTPPPLPAPNAHGAGVAGEYEIRPSVVHRSQCGRQPVRHASPHVVFHKAHIGVQGQRPAGDSKGAGPFGAARTGQPRRGLGDAIVAIRDGAGAVTYLHSDHLGSVSVMIDGNGVLIPNGKQEFDPWGSVRAGGITSTTLNYTGQRRDDTGLLFYNARYYDPQVGRFISADSVVPGNASGGMDGVALRPLTVDFHEAGLLGGLNGEGANASRLDWGGPADPQGLNRYSYVRNNPLGATDPTGHSVYMSHAEAHSYAKTMREVGGYLKMQFFGGVALSGIARKQALNAVLSLIAQRAAQGAITTVLSTALMSLVGIAIVPGALADAALIGGRLEQFADLIEEQNGSDGVILASECGLLICDVTDFYIKC